MTGDAILRSIYSGADETIADLDRLHATTGMQRARNLQRLESIVAGLNGNVPDEPDLPVERRERDGDRGRTPSDPEPFVALPQRTTHGGDFGPKVAAKLRAEALSKRGW